MTLLVCYCVCFDTDIALLDLDDNALIALDVGLDKIYIELICGRDR